MCTAYGILQKKYLARSTEPGSLLDYTKDLLYVGNLFLVEGKFDADSLRMLGTVDALVAYKYD